MNILNGLFLVTTLLTFSASAEQSTEKAGPHGGTMYHQKKGQAYEVVIHESSKEMKVYTTTVAEKLPNEMTVKVFQGKEPQSSIKLQLVQKDPKEAYYLGMVPANIAIAGGVRFEFEFFKKKKSAPSPK